MDRLDYEEEIFHSVRVLIEKFRLPPASIRRLITQAINDDPKGDLRERVVPGTAEEEPARL